MTDELSVEEQFARALAASKPAPPISDNDDPYTGVPGYKPPSAPVPQQPYQGAILPFSKDASGNVNFDSNAGLLGVAKKPFTFAHDVSTGAIPADVRNPAYMGGVFDAANTYGPGAVASRVGKGVVQAPSVDALKKSADDRFEAFRNSTQIFPGDEYRALLKQSADDLIKSGHHDVEGGATVPHETIRREAERVKNHLWVTAPEIDALKTQLSATKLKDQNLSGTMQVRDNLYGFLEKHGDENIQKGVGDWRQMKHSEAVTGKDEKTSRLNVARAQGPELDAKQTRSNIARLLNSKKDLRGFSDTERNILESANVATPGIDRAQRIGNAMQFRSTGAALGGGGLVAAATAAAAGHYVPAAALLATGAVAGGAGTAARTYANRGARRLADEADNSIRGQSPLAAENFATAPNNFSAMPGVYNPMLAAAVAARLRDGPASTPAIPQQYKVLPDGTVEEFM